MAKSVSRPRGSGNVRVAPATYNSGAPWAPTNASVGVLAWYRADDAHDAGGGLVDTWADRSGQGDANRNLTSVTGAATINASDAAYGNKTTVSGNNSSLVRAGAWSVAPATPITILVVGQLDLSPYAFLSDGVADNMLWGAGPTAFFYSTLAASLPSVSSILSTPSVVMFSDSGTIAADAAKMFVNNLSVHESSQATFFKPGTTGFDIGNGVAGVAGLYGKIAEAIVFGGILTPTDLANLKDYLNTTRAYGIAVT